MNDAQLAIAGLAAALEASGRSTGRSYTEVYGRLTFPHWAEASIMFRFPPGWVLPKDVEAHTKVVEELTAARARIAELEAWGTHVVWRDERDAAQAREAAHLAHIKALHQFLGDREEQEGIWIPRAEFKDMPKHDTAHYDAEGGEG
jgi:hypothetical protein